MKKRCSKAGQKKPTKLNKKQLLFCEEYIISLNGTRAAVAAGYSKKTAYAIANNLLKKVEVQKEIERLMRSRKKATIATQNEVLELLTLIARGEAQEDVVVVEGEGGGFSSAKIIKKQVASKEQTKALELLGKRYGLFLEHIEVTGVPQIIDDIPASKEIKTDGSAE